MKKMRYFGFILSLLAMLVSVAANPMDGKAIELLEVRNDADGGVMFVFRVEGQFTKAELEGAVQIQGGEWYPLYCKQDGDVLHCSTTRKTGGHWVTVVVGGATFWPRVPEAAQRPSACQGIIYNAYDWNVIEYNIVDSTAWASFFTFCTSGLAQDGDVLSSNLWDGINTYNYEYFSTGLDNAYCGWTNPGPGFYYQDNYACPN